MRYLPVSMQIKTFSVFDFMPPMSTVVVTILNLEVMSMLEMALMPAPVDMDCGSVMLTCGRLVFCGLVMLMRRVSFWVFFCCCWTRTRVSFFAWSTFSMVGGASNFLSSVIMDCVTITPPKATSRITCIIATTINTWYRSPRFSFLGLK